MQEFAHTLVCRRLDSVFRCNRGGWTSWRPKLQRVRMLLEELRVRRNRDLGHARLASENVFQSRLVGFTARWKQRWVIQQLTEFFEPVSWLTSFLKYDPKLCSTVERAPSDEPIQYGVLR